MPSVDVVVETKISTTTRARQICSMFDVPAEEKSRINWKGDVPIDERDWSVGLIVGPSGCGKSTLAADLFGEELRYKPKWQEKSVVDDFSAELSLEDITRACSSVGFNTVPAWLRPYAVLSNGERFRVDLARRLLEGGRRVCVDEFTSVVDRQVAKIGSHAVQKFVRRTDKQFVAVSCHYDIVDWLQPDWILEPATMTFTWRSVQPRPSVEVEIKKCERSLWRLFAPYHYMTAALSSAAQCYAAYIEGRPAAFAGVIHFPHPKARDIKRVSRLVTLPDWQGLGLAFALVDVVAGAYKAAGYRLRTYPAHPALIRSFARHKDWYCKRRPASFDASVPRAKRGNTTGSDIYKNRPCATFEWAGGTLEKSDGLALLAGSSAPAKKIAPKGSGRARRPKARRAKKTRRP